MGVAIINAIVAGVVVITHHLYYMSKSEFAMWGTILYFAIRMMPPKIPTKPQDLWTWQRDTLQAYVETKNPSLPPLHPTQPAQGAPEDQK